MGQERLHARRLAQLADREDWPRERGFGRRSWQLNAGLSSLASRLGSPYCEERGRSEVAIGLHPEFAAAVSDLGAALIDLQYAVAAASEVA